MSVQQGWSRTSLGSGRSSAGGVKRQVSHEQYKSHHILRWVALGAMSFQAQLHSEHNMKSMEEGAKVVFFPGVAAKPSNNRAVARQLLLPQHFLTKRKSIARNCQKLLRPTATNLLRLCFLTASMLWKQKLGKFIRGSFLARILGITARN